MEENVPRAPMRSKPALQKAETAVNSACQRPGMSPSLRRKTGASSAAPISSISREPQTMKRVSRTMPPTCGAATDSCMVLRCMRPIFFPER